MCGAIAELIQQGRMEGLSQGMEQGVKALIEICIEYNGTRETAQKQLMEKLQLSPESAQGYIERYWH